MYWAVGLNNFFLPDFMLKFRDKKSMSNMSYVSDVKYYNRSIIVDNSLLYV